MREEEQIAREADAARVVARGDVAHHERDGRDGDHPEKRDHRAIDAFLVLDRERIGDREGGARVRECARRARVHAWTA